MLLNCNMLQLVEEGNEDLDRERTEVERFQVRYRAIPAIIMVSSSIRNIYRKFEEVMGRRVSDGGDLLTRVRRIWEDIHLFAYRYETSGRLV